MSNVQTSEPIITCEKSDVYIPLKVKPVKMLKRTTTRKKLYEEKAEAGNTQSNHTNLYSDYQEISPWNANYVNEYKHVEKPFYRYILGTMSDFHHYLQKFPVALVAFAFLRASGMFYGISNPVMGLCGLLAALCDTWYNFIFLSWSILWSMIWCFFLRIPRELIYNGLYPSQGIIVGYAMYVTYGAHPNVTMFTQLIALVPILFFNIILFQALCNVFVTKLHVTPMMTSGVFLGMAWQLAIQKSHHFYTNGYIPSLVAPLGPNATQDITFLGRDWFDITPGEYGIEIVYGVAMLQFSSSKWSAIPICIGLASASPIMFVTTWLGSFVGISTLACLSPDWDLGTVRFGLYGINASITASVLIGNFFVLNFASVILGVLAVMCSMMLTMALQSFCQPLGISYFALPATIICITCYMTAGSFPSLIPVELLSLTVPEDHLRRFYLSKLVMKQFLLSTKLKEFKDMSPKKLQMIERSMLPVLLCAYAKNGNLVHITQLMEYGADPNMSDYDGRCALHIGAAENNMDVVKLLLRWNADCSKKDNYSNTPLSDALKGGHVDMAKLLSSKGGQICLQNTEIASKLCYYVYNEDHKGLRHWLECGANPSLADYDNRTPLHIAYARKNREAIKLLEQYSANKLLKDRWGNTPVDCLGSLVIENKAAATFVETKFPYQPISAKGISAKQLDADLISEVVKSLMRQDTVDVAMETALVPSLICALVYMQETATLDELLHMDFDINVEDYDRRTPLHIAASVGSLETTKLLLWNSADPNALDRFGYSPLFEAVQHKHDNVCKHLRSAGAKLCMSKEMEVSTLCWAVYNNDFDMLTRLVENGANLNAVDYDERSCYHIAKDAENQNMTNHIENLIKRDRRKSTIQEKVLKSLEESTESRNSRSNSGNSEETKI